MTTDRVDAARAHDVAVDRSLLSFGRYPAVAQRAVDLAEPVLPAVPTSSMLARGAGRSYGDSCLATDEGVLLRTHRLDRFIAFDAHAGIVRCDAGVTLADLIDVALPRGWFPAVVPGTRYVTVGGALANDVHGKNHHRAGTFGDHVRRFGLARSDGSHRTIERDDPLFAATVGGLGLTGLVTWVELALARVPGAWLDVSAERFESPDAYFDRAAALEREHEYTVAWVDCAGSRRGRGVLYAANHSSDPRPAPPRAKLAFPVESPISLVNRASLAAFNEAYFRVAPARRAISRRTWEGFFFPLDRIAHWNRAYGRRGFLQHQCVVPPRAARDAIPALLDAIAHAGDGSMLVVLKNFAARPSAGLLSFARAGTTLALDFPFRGERTLALLERLDAIVREAGGAVYPAKDARMSRETFRASFPNADAMRSHFDPAFRSRFSDRVGLTSAP